MTETLFDRILVGIDGSPEAFAALAQARRLLPPDGELRALVVCEEHLAVHSGPEAPRLAVELHADAEAAAARARALLRDTPAAEVELVHGRAGDRLLRAAKEMGATLVAVGVHSHTRAGAILLGSVADRLLHDVSAAILLARRGGAAESFPARVVAGADGSPASLEAVAVARALASRVRAGTRVVVAAGGKSLDSAGLVELRPFERDPRSPVDALLAAAAEADLLVLGSRGLHGPAALGSVSERVAHRAPCSVLIVHGGKERMRAAPPGAYAGAMSAR